ncbi:MAG: PaaI family thioesterase [Desulfomonilaceae bacterium]
MKTKDHKAIDHATDPLKYAAEVVGRDPFASFLGIKVEEVRDSYARVSLVIREEYCNAEARSHGAALFALADQALAVAAHASKPKSFSIEVKINYFQAARAGDTVIAEATPVDIRRRISVWNVELHTASGDKIAAAQGLAYHFV